VGGTRVVSRAHARAVSATTRLPRSRGEASTDPRVGAVLDVLAGIPAAEVALRHAIDVSLLRRWVRAFVDAGTATVTNRPSDEAARGRDRYLASFAHELRTPLAVAKGWSSILTDSEGLPEGAARAGARIDAALGQMTERLLDAELLVSASLGRLRLRPERITVHDLVEGLPGLPAVQGLGGEVALDADRATARVVLRDLWVAADTLPAPRARWIEVNRIASWVEVRIVREGTPIDPGALRALFEPFDQNADDTGITTGLYLARALAVAHGGIIGVEQDDARTDFWVRLPRHAGLRSTKEEA
jgi:signal transduction histidine kinase